MIEQGLQKELSASGQVRSKLSPGVPNLPVA